MFDFDYRKFGTKRQIEIMETVEKTGSVRNAAKYLGISRSTARGAIDSCKSNAAIKGGVEFKKLDPVPEGFLLKGESLLHNKRTGEDLLVWRKTKIDDAQRWEMIKSAIEEACKEIPRAKISPIPKEVDKSLCNMFVITDYHLGQYSWPAETGEAWDIDIAESLIVKSFERMIAAAPKAGVAIFAQLGDFLHTDNFSGTTPASSHILDVDSRYPKVARSATRIVRRVIDMLLLRHEQVIFLSADANHDPVGGGVWLREIVRNTYEKDKRVQILDSETSYYVYRHGKTMLGFHHGHLTKMEQLDRIFASRYAEIWGKTKYRFAHSGHFHHQKEIDQHGMHIMQHPTLAAMDAYASKHGYSATRKTHVITYSTEFGEIGRISVDPMMFR